MDWQSIGNYQVIAKLGQGGMGIVYRAMRIDNHYFKQVAIKLARTGLGSEHHFRPQETSRRSWIALKIQY
jgi:serine/threonine protein kinase